MLGLIVTDTVPGYGHITAAISDAMAAACGASFSCYVTPTEHLSLPDIDDVREGIIASKIAVHAVDIVKGVKGVMDWDHQMTVVRGNLDWERMFALTMDPGRARAYRAQSAPEREDTRTMCGKMCTIRNMNKLLCGEIIDIMEED